MRLRHPLRICASLVGVVCGSARSECVDSCVRYDSFTKTLQYTATHCNTTDLLVVLKMEWNKN